MHERFESIVCIRDGAEARQAETVVGDMIAEFGRDLLYVFKKRFGADCVDPEAPGATTKETEDDLLKLKTHLIDHRVLRVVKDYREKRLRGEENDVRCNRPGVTVYVAARAANNFNARIPSARRSQKRFVLPQPVNGEVSSVYLEFFGYHAGGDQLCLDDLTQVDSKLNFSFPVEHIVCVVGDHGTFWQNPDPAMVELTKALDEQQT